jgi:hypothetical protein
MTTKLLKPSIGRHRPLMPRCSPKHHERSSEPAAHELKKDGAFGSTLRRMSGAHKGQPNEPVCFYNARGSSIILL